MLLVYDGQRALGRATDTTSFGAVLHLNLSGGRVGKVNFVLDAVDIEIRLGLTILVSRHDSIVNVHVIRVPDIVGRFPFP